MTKDEIRGAMGVALGVLARHCEALERRGLGTATRENSREGMLLTQSEAMAVQAAVRAFQLALEDIADPPAPGAPPRRVFP